MPEREPSDNPLLAPKSPEQTPEDPTCRQCGQELGQLSLSETVEMANNLDDVKAPAEQDQLNERAKEMLRDSSVAKTSPRLVGGVVVRTGRGRITPITFGKRKRVKITDSEVQIPKRAKK